MSAGGDAVARFGRSLARGQATRARLVTQDEQVRRYAEGTRRNEQDMGMVRSVLTQTGLDRVLPQFYVPFCMRVLRLCRWYSGETRNQLLAGFAAEWALRLPGTAAREEQQARLRAVAERLSARYDEAQAGLSAGQC